MDGGGLGQPQLVVHELGDGLALEGIAVGGAQVAGVLGPRSGAVSAGRVLDGEMVVRPAFVSVAMPPTVSSEQAEPMRPTSGRVGGQLLGRRGAALGRAQGVLGDDLDGMTLDLVVAVIGRDRTSS